MPELATDQPVPALTNDELAFAYEQAVRSRSTEEHIVRLASRGEVKFAMWGPGEEVHGAATALALTKVALTPENFGIVPHYRSGCLVATWCALNGYPDFTRTMLRQQFSKDTDPMSRGRQMVYHLDLPTMGVLPVQSPVGMQLGKAAGYALGMKKKGQVGLAMGIIGDGTSAEGDLHDAMNAASVWQVPCVLMVTDNGIAISTTPDEGRGIKSFEKYAQGFGIRFFSCNGSDFEDTYSTTVEALQYVLSEQKPIFFHVHSLPRFNGHSSAADMTFDLAQADPLVAWGEELVRAGVLEDADIMKRVEGQGRDFFAHHDLGRVMGRADEEIKAIFDEVRAEPDPPDESVLEHIRPPLPSVVESTPQDGTTNITYGAAIRSALDHVMASGKGVILGQDVGKLGGVMQATAGLHGRYPERVIDAPLNEPLILGTATGLGLHSDLHALPEIQFGDYSLNAFHWLVYLGTMWWASNGQTTSKLTLRMPTDPFGGGAVYHSMSVDGYFTPIPGLVVVMPSTSWDVYGLLRTASDYDGPVVFLEPKWMYRQTLGPAFPGEPTDAGEINAMKKAVMRGEIPDIDADLRVPFGKGVVRRQGSDITVVAWGRAVWTAMSAAKVLAGQGIDCEVIDLRTLVPPDMDLVKESVARTGRLIVAAEDRNFAGFVRSIQGQAVEAFPGLPCRALGQKNVPGIAQSLKLEAATILTDKDIAAAAHELMEVELSGKKSWRFVPPRFFVS